MKFKHEFNNYKDNMVVNKMILAFNKVKAHTEGEIVYMGLYGSQNYNLDDELSDVDVRAIVIPPFREILMGKKISKKLTYEHGDIDVKDLKSYYESARKGNPSFIEPLHSKYALSENEVISELILDTLQPIPLNLQQCHSIMHSVLKHCEKHKNPKDVAQYYRMLNLILENKDSEYFVPFIVYERSNRRLMLKLKRDTTNLEWELDRAKRSLERFENFLEGYQYEKSDLYNEIADIYAYHIAYTGKTGGCKGGKSS